MWGVQNKFETNETKQEGYRTILFSTAQGYNLGCSVLSLFKFHYKKHDHVTVVKLKSPCSKW